MMIMSKIEAAGGKAKDSSDWNHAWKVVSRLAAARASTLNEIRKDDRSLSGPSTRLDQGRAPHAPALTAKPFAPIAPDQLTRNIAEIERAAAALRRAEPTLELRFPEAGIISEPRPSLSIWPLLCVIWLTAVLVVSGVIGATVLLFG
jgi:hypothetical protein